MKALGKSAEELIRKPKTHCSSNVEMGVISRILRMGCKMIETCAPKCPISLCNASEWTAAVRAAKPINRVLDNVFGIMSGVENSATYRF